MNQNHVGLQTQIRDDVLVIDAAAQAAKGLYVLVEEIVDERPFLRCGIGTQVLLLKVPKTTRRVLPFRNVSFSSIVGCRLQLQATGPTHWTIFHR